MMFAILWTFASDLLIVAAVWATWCAGKAGTDRINIQVLIYKIPPWANRLPAYELLAAVSFRRHIFYRFFFLGWEQLYQGVYTAIEWELAKEMNRIDAVGRLWAIEEARRRERTAKS